MALVKSTLAGLLESIFTSHPTTRSEAATLITNAYDTYAIVAQSCAGLTPTLVQKPVLEYHLDTSLGADNNSYAEAAADWATAFTIYWAGGQFGGAGTVTVIGGTTALEAGLAALWSGYIGSPVTYAQAASDHADLLDLFTKTVTVTDSSIPCGPAPIT